MTLEVVMNSTMDFCVSELMVSSNACHEPEDRTFGRLHIGDGLTPRHHSGWCERSRSSFQGYLERGGDIIRPEREFGPAHPVAARPAVAVRSINIPASCDAIATA